MSSQSYFAREAAAMPLKLARVSSDANLAAAFVERAADL
jgi:hypothetical protein